jgi:hypothetical protein
MFQHFILKIEFHELVEAVVGAIMKSPTFPTMYLLWWPSDDGTITPKV